MTPYGTFLFFILIAILLAPTVILGLIGKRFLTYNVIITVLVLGLIFLSKQSQMHALIFFIIWQVLLVKGYMAYRRKENSSICFYLAVFLSLLPLLLSKLSPYFSITNLWGFLGISYITFKSTQVIIETRDGIMKNNISIVRLLYFMLFFPTLSSGPIDRYRRFEKDLMTKLTREEYKLLLYEGINKIFLGFLYKYILGYSINHYFIANIDLFDRSFQNQLYYMYAYSFYLFFDFAGYSAFAIGVSYIMGIKTPENFNKPFISRNMMDFWNRWNIRLSFWFRDYVFMRFVLMMTKKKWIKNKNVISSLGYILLFLSIGLWHGLQVQYIIYGLYHGVLMVFNTLFDRFNKKYKWWPQNKYTHVIAVVITFQLICFGFYIFSGQLIHS